MQTTTGNIKARVGVAIVLVLITGLIALPPMILNVMGLGQKTLVMQISNSHALVNGEITQMTAPKSGKSSPYIASGTLVAPLRWLADNMNLGIEWNKVTKTITLTNSSQTKVTMAIGQKSMTADGETVALDAPTMQVNGVTYVPVRAISDAFGWNLAFVEEADGGLIFLDNKKYASEPNKAQIARALKLLGPSQTQMLADGVVARVGSDFVRNGNGEIQLTNEGDGVALIRRTSDTDTWIPMQSMASLFGATVQQDGNTYSLLRASGDTVTVGTATDGSGQEAFATAQASLSPIRVVRGIPYTTMQTLSRDLGLYGTELGGGIVALTKMSLDGYSDQQAYLRTLAKELPKKSSVTDVPKADAYIALTFDDGPTGGRKGLTVKLLNGLRARGAHATFFMCGYRIDDFHTHMSRYLADGNQLGNHTYSHAGIMTKMTAGRVYQEFEKNNLLIQSYCGEQPTVGRPVGGVYDDMVLEQMRRAGLAAILWSVDTRDWKYKDAVHVKNAIISRAKDGDIILMHDLYPTTVEGVLAAIDILKQKNYGFVTVEELAALKGVILEPGKVYRRFR